MNNRQIRLEAQTLIKGNKLWTVLKGLFVLFILELVPRVVTTVTTDYASLADFFSKGDSNSTQFFDVSYTANLITLIVPVATVLAYTWVLRYIRTSQTTIDDYFKPVASLRGFLYPIWVSIIIGIKMIIGFILLFIPGILVIIKYSQVMFVMADLPGLRASEYQRISREMMIGHKGQWFRLAFSFIGWYLLEALTCGILSIYVLPYKSTAFALFYEQIRVEYAQTHPGLFQEVDNIDANVPPQDDSNAVQQLFDFAEKDDETYREDK